MVHALKTTVDSDIEHLFDPVYENILHRSAFLDDEKASCINRTLLEFSTLPDDFARLCEALEDENSGAKQVADLVHFNPSLAAKVLKLVNSAHYGLQGKVSNLQRAVLILGFKVMHSLLLCTNLFSSASSKNLSAGLTLTDLWNHSVAVSQITRITGSKVGRVDVAMLISAGLLHDAGKLLLSVYNSASFERALKEAEEIQGDLLDCELRSLGITHPIMSSALIVKWHLPPRLQDAIMFQQHPGLAEDKRSAAVLMLSEYYARSYEIGSDGQPAWGFPPEEALKELDISYERVKGLITPGEIQEIVEHIETLAKTCE